MKVTIFGSGYVGLVTGACLAEVGNDVLCMDVDQEKIDKLRRGVIPIYEPDLDQMVERNMAAGRLAFTTDPEEAVKHGLFQFIAVGTPPDEDGSADLQYVLAVAQTIAEHMDEYRIVVDKSTVPVGTADKVRSRIEETLAKRGKSVEFDVVSNPEFLKEGAAIEDFMKPDRIVIGTDNPRTTELLRALYAPFNRNRDRLIAMDIRSAELTKYAANAMLATKISFMNELANLAERLGADIEKVRHGIGSDSRIGYAFIYPGCGYGGSCFPKDVQALERTAREVGYDARLLNAVEAVNRDQKRRIYEKIHDHFDGQLAGKTIALWGLAFKPNTDDLRESPAMEIAHLLQNEGALVCGYDPVAMPGAAKINPEMRLAEDPYELAQGVDALLLCTEWDEFKNLDMVRIKSAMAQPILVDGRNVYDPAQMQALGFTYRGVGRGNQNGY